jgi:hypothetical protein
MQVICEGHLLKDCQADVIGMGMFLPVLLGPPDAFYLLLVVAFYVRWRQIYADRVMDRYTKPGNTSRLWGESSISGRVITEAGSRHHSVPVRASTI